MDSEDRDGAGIVYIMRNPAFDEYVKIGMTTKSVDERRRGLSGTNVPEEFECLKAVRCSNAREVEKSMHTIFSHRRRKGEFFKLEGEDEETQAYGILEMLRHVDPNFEDVTPAGNDGEFVETKAIRSTAKIVEKLGLVGKTIMFADDECITATIHSVKGSRMRVMFEGEEMTFSHAAHTAYRKWSGKDSGAWFPTVLMDSRRPGVAAPQKEPAGAEGRIQRIGGSGFRIMSLNTAQERHMHDRAGRPRLTRNPLLETARMTRADLDAGYERERKSRIRNLASEFMRGVIRHGNQSRNFFFGPDIIEYKTILQGNREVYVFARRSTMEFEDGFYPKVTIWPHVVTSSIAEDRETADLVIEHLRGMRGMRDIGSLHGMLGDHDFDFVLEIKDKEEDRG